MKTFKSIIYGLLISIVAKSNGDFLTLDYNGGLNDTRTGDSDESFEYVDMRTGVEPQNTSDPCDTNHEENMARLDEYRKWKKVYSYSIDSGIEKERENIKKIMEHLYDHMNWYGDCLAFQEVRADSGITPRVHIYYNASGGCYSSNIGMSGGVQKIQLNRNCYGWIWLTTHEILHSLGLIHEHSRSDRDDYIILHKDKIKPGREHDFKIRYDDNYDQPYNYHSIMHYNQDWASIDGKNVWQPRHFKWDFDYNKCPDYGKYGFCDHRVDPWIERLMKTDVRKLRRMYRCPPDKQGDMYP